MDNNPTAGICTVRILQKNKG